MKRTAFATLVFCALTAGSGYALAGKSKKTTVKITSAVDPVDGKTVLTAVGGLKAARASTDTTQYITCKVTKEIAFDNSRTPLVVCFAQDKDGVTATCDSREAIDVQNASAINETSVISFKVKLSAKPNCRDLTIENDSRNL